MAYLHSEQPFKNCDKTLVALEVFDGDQEKLKVAIKRIEDGIKKFDQMTYDHQVDTLIAQLINQEIKEEDRVIVFAELLNRAKKAPIKNQDLICILY